MDAEESYFTPDEVATIYRVTGTTVRRLIRNGEIPAVKVGSQYRIPRSAMNGRSPSSVGARTTRGTD